MLMVTKDRVIQHPVIAQLQEHGAEVLSGQGRSKYDDFALLAHCPHLALGLSSFSLAAAMMNTNRKHVYMPLFPEIMYAFQDEMGWMLLPEHGKVHIRSRMGSWLTMWNPQVTTSTSPLASEVSLLQNATYRFNYDTSSIDIH